MSDRRKSRRSSSRSHSRGKKHYKSSNPPKKSHDSKTYQDESSSRQHEHKSNHKRQSRSRSPSSDDNRKHKNQRDRYLGSSQQWNFKSKFEESKWLAIEGLPDEVTAKDIEEKLTQVSADCGTSVYEEIKLVPYLASAYVLYPSMSAASKTLYHLKGKVKLRDTFYAIDFYGGNPSTGVTTGPALIYEPAETSDWICDNCEYKNFAKRSKCNRCERPRTINCRVIPTLSSKQTNPNLEQNTSLMVRGSSVTYVSEQDFYNAFDSIAKIKSVRMLKNKSTQTQRDFAFVEFFTLEEAEKVLAVANEPGFTLVGEPVQVFVSRNKRFEEDIHLKTALMPPPNPGMITPNFDYSQYYQQMYGHMNHQAAFIEKTAAAAGYSIQPFPKQLEPLPLHVPYIASGHLNLPAPPLIGVGLPAGLQAGGIAEVNQVNEQEMQMALIKQALENAKNHSLLIQQQQKSKPKEQKEAEVGNQQQLSQQQQQVQLDSSNDVIIQSKLNESSPNQIIQTSHLIPDLIFHQSQTQHSQLIQQQKQEQLNKKQDANEKPDRQKQLQQQQQQEQQQALLNQQQKLQQQQQQQQSKLQQVQQQQEQKKKIEGNNPQIKKDVEEKEKQKKFQQKEQENEIEKEQENQGHIKVISFELESLTPKKSKLFICSLCKRKFESERSVELHYLYSEMHKQNALLYQLK